MAKGNDLRSRLELSNLTAVDWPSLVSRGCVQAYRDLLVLLEMRSANHLPCAVSTSNEDAVVAPLFCPLIGLPQRQNLDEMAIHQVVLAAFSFSKEA